MSFGIQLNKNGVLAVAPDFIPMCLIQVIDITSGMHRIVTNIPGSNKFVAFHRHLTQMDTLLWTVSISDGFYVITTSGDAENRTGGRIYIFSNMIPRPPEWGLFLYKQGGVIWHNRCLPLSVKIHKGATELNSDTPIAVPSMISASYNIRLGQREGWYGWRCASAGIIPDTGKYQISLGGSVISQNYYVDGSTYPGSFTLMETAYIETDVYDNYFSASLKD